MQLVGNPAHGSLMLYGDGSFSYTPEVGFAGTDAFTYQVHDGTTTSNVATVTLTVQDVNQPPQVYVPGPLTNNEGDSVYVGLMAWDPDGDTLSFSAAGLPRGLTLDSASGVISGTLDYESSGSYVVSVTVTDGQGATATGSFTWEVANVNRAPVLTNPGDQTSDEGEWAFLWLDASDPDGDPVTYSATGLPAGLGRNELTGWIAGIVDYDAAETQVVSF